jgi:hypothetical protein
VSRPLCVDGRDLVLCARDGGGYWVRRADNRRTLGVVVKVRSRWNWVTTSNAFRGDGRPGSERDGSASDKVPDSLAGTGRASAQRDACAALIGHLDARRAPVLGYAPHPDVRVAQEAGCS